MGGRRNTIVGAAVCLIVVVVAVVFWPQHALNYPRWLSHISLSAVGLRIPEDMWPGCDAALDSHDRPVAGRWVGNITDANRPPATTEQELLNGTLTLFSRRDAVYAWHGWKLAMVPGGCPKADDP